MALSLTTGHLFEFTFLMISYKLVVLTDRLSILEFLKDKEECHVSDPEYKGCV